MSSRTMSIKPYIVILYRLHWQLETSSKFALVKICWCSIVFQTQLDEIYNSAYGTSVVHKEYEEFGHLFIFY